jgi:hypothetical protein
VHDTPPGQKMDIKEFDFDREAKKVTEKGDRQRKLVLDILKDNLYYMEVDFYVSYIFEEKLLKYITPNDYRKLQEQEEQEKEQE